MRVPSLPRSTDVSLSSRSVYCNVFRKKFVAHQSEYSFQICFYPAYENVCGSCLISSFDILSVITFPFTAKQISFLRK
jgi:hypothetical protein